MAVAGEVLEARKEKERARSRRRYAANKEYYLEKSKKWKAANPAKVAEIKERYANRNPDAQKVATEKWRAAHPGWSAKVKRAWRRSNPEKEKAAIRRWVKANPEKVRAGILLRRARLVLAGQPRHGQLSGDDIKTIVSRQKGRCAACGERAKLTMDHIMPLALGGGGHRHNFQGLCKPCNSRKHAKHPIDFNRSLGLLL